MTLIAETAVTIIITTKMLIEIDNNSNKFDHF